MQSLPPPTAVQEREAADEVTALLCGAPTLLDVIKAELQDVDHPCFPLLPHALLPDLQGKQNPKAG